MAYQPPHQGGPSGNQPLPNQNGMNPQQPQQFQQPQAPKPFPPNGAGAAPFPAPNQYSAPTNGYPLQLQSLRSIDDKSSDDSNGEEDGFVQWMRGFEGDRVECRKRSRRKMLSQDEGVRQLRQRLNQLVEEELLMEWMEEFDEERVEWERTRRRLEAEARERAFGEWMRGFEGDLEELERNRRIEILRPFRERLNRIIAGDQLPVDDSDDDGLPSEVERLEEEQSSNPSTDQYTRACIVCAVENPIKRAAFTQCGHIVCYPCAERNARSGASGGRCVFCRATGGFVILHEDKKDVTVER